MRLLKRWVAAIVVAVAVMGPMQTPSMRPSVAQGQSGDEINDAPYIYYYSIDLNAWVIERADGSDRRLLGQGLMLEGTNAVGGPGWSPSGKFFAWTSYWGGPYNATDWDGWVMSADGQNIVAHFGGTDDSGYMTMKWSPSADLLIVAEIGHKSVLTTGDSFYVNSHFSLFNAETGQTIASLHTITEDFASDIALWTNDGRFAITRARSTDERVTQFYLFSPDGTIFERLIPDFIYEMPSPTGVLILDTPDGPSLVDLITSTTRPLTATWGFPDPTYDEYSRSYTVDWNSSGTQGLIKWGGSWLVDVAAEHIRQITPLNAGGPAEWSPDERYIFVKQQSYEESRGYSYLVEVATGRVFDLPYYDEVDFYGNPNDTGWQWVSNQYLLIYGAIVPPLSSEWTGEIFATLVEVSTGKVETWELSQGRVAELFVSPDLRYLSWIDEGPIILNRETDLITRIRPNTHSFDSSPGGEIRWHPSQEWLIETKYASVTNGIGPYRWVSLMRPDGTQHRELTYCYRMAYCVQWLPDRIDPSTLPAVSIPTPPQINPVQTIMVSHWPGFLEWSPDGRLLVMDAIRYDSNHFRVYDVWEGKPIADLEISENQKPDWQLNTAGEYEAVAIDLEANERFRYSSLDPVISPDSRFAASFYPYPVQPIQIVDTERKEIIGELDTPASAVAFSPDGEYLAVGVSWDVEIWRVSDLIREGEEAE